MCMVDVWLGERLGEEMIILNLIQYTITVILNTNSYSILHYFKTQRGCLTLKFLNLIFDGYVSVHLLYILSDFMFTQTGTVEFL
jgi:hypothetical protein